MKKILNILFLLGSVNFANSQANNISSLKYGTKKEINTSKKERVVSGKYIIKEAKLKTFFIGELIPITFPPYDYSINYQENKTIIKTWLKANQSLIKPEEVQRYKNRKTEPFKLK